MFLKAIVSLQAANTTNVIRECSHFVRSLGNPDLAQVTLDSGTIRSFFTFANIFDWRTPGKAGTPASISGVLLRQDIFIK